MRYFVRLLLVLFPGILWTVPLGAAPPRQFAPTSYTGMYAERVWHGDGCGCDVCSAACWDPCRPTCCLGIVPAVIRGVDRILYGLFAGFRCCDPCGTSCGITGCAAPHCADCHGGLEMIPSEPVPAAEDMSAYRYPTRTTVRPDYRAARGPAYYPTPSVRSRSTGQPTGPVTSSPKVRSTSAQRAEPLRQVSEPVELVPVDNTLRPASYETPIPKSTRHIPHNPLRD